MVTFRVRPDANKVEIRSAVEAVFNVKVTAVRTAGYEGKLKRMGRYQGRRPDWKKAVVKLAPGHKIELVEGGLAMPIRTVKPTSPARRYLTYVPTRRSRSRSREEACSVEASSNQRPQQPTGASRSATGAAGTSGCCVMSTSGARSSASGPVAAIEYDPNRSARLALLHYRDGEKRYIIAPHGLKVGDTLMSGPQADILPGNALPLRNIPVGTLVHNVELHPGRGAQLCRSAGPRPSSWPRRAEATLQAPSGRSAAGRPGMHGDDRAGRQPRPRERLGGQGRPSTLAWLPPDGAGHRDESGGPPDGRRRRERARATTR